MIHIWIVTMHLCKLIADYRLRLYKDFLANAVVDALRDLYDERPVYQSLRSIFFKPIFPLFRNLPTASTLQVTKKANIIQKLTWYLSGGHHYRLRRLHSHCC
jgi:hypothetical protein